MTNIDSSRYTISVKKITEDNVDYYEAKVKELPDVAEYGDSVEEVYALAIDTIEITAEIFEKEGKPFPLPLPDIEAFSGRTSLRMPKTLHRNLTHSAGCEGVSLNAFINSILDYYIGAASQQRMIKQTKVVACTQEQRQKVAYESNVVPIHTRSAVVGWQ